MVDEASMLMMSSVRELLVVLDLALGALGQSEVKYSLDPEAIWDAKA